MSQSTTAGPFRLRRFDLSSLRELGILVVLILLLIVLSIISPNQVFARPANLINILKQASINGILATGMMFVIISGGIDLSVGSIVAFTGVLAALSALPNGNPLIVTILIAAAAGALVGVVNGVGVTYGNIPPFIVTLGTLTIVRGLALIAAGGQPIFGVTPEFEALGDEFLFGVIPYLVIYYLAITGICAFVLTMTVFGRRVYAVGGNEVAARVSGINVNRIKIAVYTLSGLLAGLAGMLLSSRLVSGNPTAGQGYELDAIAAVVIGGVSMTGGAGKWYGTIIGALMIAVIGNGLDILAVSSYYQYLIKGGIIIGAVLLDMKSKARST